MELFIRLENGEPVDHPILKENFQQAFPDIDINSLPDNFAIFERVETPNPGVYEVVDSVYGWEEGVVKDIHTIRPMTDTERTAKQNTVKQMYIAQGGYPSWIFDEEICSYRPPLDPPQDGKLYKWNEDVVNWVEVIPEQ